MLPKEYRLPLRTELHRVQKAGKVYHFPYFGFLVAKSDLPVSRFAFIVSEKIHKRATKRNRVKRLLRESVKSLLSKTEPGFDVVFLAKKRISDQDYSLISAAVKKAFEKTKIL